MRCRLASVRHATPLLTRALVPRPSVQHGTGEREHGPFPLGPVRPQAVEQLASHPDSSDRPSTLTQRQHTPDPCRLAIAGGRRLLVPSA